MPQFLRESIQQCFVDHNLQIPETLDEIHNLKDHRARLVALLYRRHSLTRKLSQHGCVPSLIYDRARTYEQLEYDDLAIFDGYVIYVLCQKRHYEILEEDEFVTDLEALNESGESWAPGQSDLMAFMTSVVELLVRCLRRLGAIKDAEVLLERFIYLQNDRNEVPRQFGRINIAKSGMNGITSIPHSRREIYPWSSFEPDRNSVESVAEINRYLASIAPKLEAKVTRLPALTSHNQATEEIWTQLGLFTKSKAGCGEVMLTEKSVLTAIRPLDDAICDACGQDLEGISLEDVCQCEAEDCDTTFCSEDCKTKATEQYHKPYVELTDSEDGNESVKVRVPTICLQPDVHLIGRDTNTETPEWDLYFLLLTRTVAMSTAQQKHPLELLEVKYLWADFNDCPFTEFLTTPYSSFAKSYMYERTLPFSFQHSVILPLEYMTTFASTSSEAAKLMPYSTFWLENFDAWITQTLYAKFRGVANATQSTYDGKAEIAAVHLGWCLANHSCEPNVRWSPTGVREFTVLDRDIDAGEEIFSHYTDVRLPVTERRARLREVLGGTCMCPRCVREDT